MLKFDHLQLGVLEAYIVLYQLPFPIWLLLSGAYLRSATAGRCYVFRRLFIKFRRIDILRCFLSRLRSFGIWFRHEIEIHSVLLLLLFWCLSLVFRFVCGSIGSCVRGVRRGMPRLLFMPLLDWLRLRRRLIVLYGDFALSTLNCHWRSSGRCPCHMLFELGGKYFVISLLPGRFYHLFYLLFNN